MDCGLANCVMWIYDDHGIGIMIEIWECIMSTISSLTPSLRNVDHDDDLKTHSGEKFNKCKEAVELLNS